MNRFLSAMLVVVTTFVIVGCSESDTNGPRKYSTSDLSGTWLGMVTIDRDGVQMDMIVGLTISENGEITDFVGPVNIGLLGGSLSVSESGLVTGTITFSWTESETEMTAEVACDGLLRSETDVSLEATGSWSDDTGGSGDVGFSGLLSTEGFEHVRVLLTYWPNEADQWRLSFNVFCEGASRVYTTGHYVSGEYDLYDCMNYSYCDVWISTNDPMCGGEMPHYRLDEEPVLPFDLTVHLVRESGTTTGTVTVNSYIYQE